MTLTTPVSESRPHKIQPAFDSSRDRGRSQAGFSLAEMLIVMTAMVIIMGTVATSLTHIMRGDVKMTQYSIMSTQGRLATRYFGADVRKASEIQSNGSANFTLQIPLEGGGTESVEYLYTPGDSRLVRTKGGFSRLLLDGIQSL